MAEEMINFEDIYNNMEKCVLNIICAFNSEAIQIDSSKQSIKDILINNKQNIQEINEKADELNSKYNDEKLTCDNMFKSLNEKKIELKKYEVELSNLDNTIHELVKEYEKIEQNLIKIDKKMKLSSDDKKTFDLSRKKLELYGEMTNINWDYSVPLSSAVSRGYIVKEDKNCINAFELNKNQNSQTFSEKMWKEIELGSGEDWSDIVAMTNMEKL